MWCVHFFRGSYDAQQVNWKQWLESAGIRDRTRCFLLVLGEGVGPHFSNCLRGRAFFHVHLHAQHIFLCSLSIFKHQIQGESLFVVDVISDLHDHRSQTWHAYEMFIFHFTSIFKPLPHKYSIGVLAYDAFTSFSGHESCRSVCRVGFSRNVPLLVESVQIRSRKVTWSLSSKKSLEMILW